METSKILVFAGPTISGQKAFKEKFSDQFVFHPPVSCGQLFEAYREGYRKFLIIDGYFDRIPSVWHKEILYVLSKGCSLWGCSSMGALRALETEAYGMTGAGKVFADYKTAKIADDDEVTVSHLGESQDFLPVTDAMINIRYTLAHAVDSRILSQDQAGRISKLCKATFFKKRSLRNAAAEILKNDKSTLVRFIKYLDSNGLQDQKQKDALELIEFISKNKTKPDKRFVREPFHHTTKLKDLQYLCNIKPPTLNCCALKRENRPVYLANFMIGKQRRLQSLLAIAMMLYSDAAPKIKGNSNLKLNWIDQSCLSDEKVRGLFTSALALCPDYKSTDDIPLTVRHLAQGIEFPVQLINFEKENLSLDSLSHYSRLLWLIGLFTDALAKSNPVMQKIEPSLPVHEKLHLILNEKHILRCFDPKEEEVFWYRLSTEICGLYGRLATLENENVCRKFSEEFCAALEKLPEDRKNEYFALSALPDYLTTPDSVKNYIQNCFNC